MGGENRSGKVWVNCPRSYLAVYLSPKPKFSDYTTRCPTISPNKEKVVIDLEKTYVCTFQIMILAKYLGTNDLNITVFCPLFIRHNANADNAHV